MAELNNEKNHKLRMRKAVNSYFSICLEDNSDGQKTPKNTGLGDLLYKVDSLYNLGLFLGLSYVHQVFSLPRYANSSELFSLLGLDGRNFKQGSKTKEVVNLNLSDITSFDAEVILKIKEDISNITTNGSCSKNFILSATAKQSIDILLALRELDWRFVFEKDWQLSKIFAKRSHLFLENLPINSKKIIILHQRLGDISLIKLGNNSYLSAWGKKGESFSRGDSIRRLTSRQESKRLSLSFDYYLSIIKELQSKNNTRDCFIVFCSDGYKRGAQHLIENMSKLNLSNEEKQSLKFFKENQDTLQRDVLKSIGVLPIIGEEERSLIEVLSLCTMADVVFSPSGHFLSSFCRYYSENRNQLIFAKKEALHYEQHPCVFREWKKNTDPSGVAQIMLDYLLEEGSKNH